MVKILCLSLLCTFLKLTCSRALEIAIFNPAEKSKGLSVSHITQGSEKQNISQFFFLVQGVSFKYIHIHYSWLKIMQFCIFARVAWFIITTYKIFVKMIYLENPELINDLTTLPAYIFEYCCCRIPGKKGMEYSDTWGQMLQMIHSRVQTQEVFGQQVNTG